MDKTIGAAPSPTGHLLKLHRAMQLDVAGITDRGRQRERNEDQFLIATLQRSLTVRSTSAPEGPRNWLPNQVEGTILMVADGMGGAGAGDLASSAALRGVVDYLTNVMPWAEARARKTDPNMLASTIPGVRAGLQNAMASGAAEVARAAQDSPDSPNMGTTLTLAYLLWPHLYVAHAGDSRCYLRRGGKFDCITTDHTYAERIKERTDVELHESSPWHHVLWNVLGGGDNAELEPEVHRLGLMPDDRLVLCSDGVNKHVSDTALAMIVDQAPSSAAACRRIVAQANEGGGTDNITVVVAHCRLGSGGAPRPDEAPTVKR